MLAINTAFMTANLALKTPEGVTVLKDIDAKSKHSENVLKTIDEMCMQANENVLDVGTIAVVVGPGSFTGLRIGVAIAKALGCVNNELKFVGMSSLELMAYIYVNNFKPKGDFVCVLNALSGLYFVAKFNSDGRKIEKEAMIDGDGLSKYDEQFVVLNGDLHLQNAHEIEIDCQSVLDFALKKEAEKEFVSQSNLEPVYLRSSQAEDNLKKNIKND